MRVATFNVCHATRGFGTPVDFEATLAACDALDADILALEEVDMFDRRHIAPNQARTIAAELGMAHVFAPARTHDGVTSGNALLARGDIHAVEVVALRGSIRRRWPLRDRRGAIVASVAVDGHPISVAVAHLSLDRVDSLAQERRVLDALARRDSPRLLLGDLNRRTAWVRSATDRAGLTLALDDEPTAPRTGPRFRIDHIAVAGLRIDQVAVIDTGTSDHRALVAEVSRLEVPAQH